MPELTVGALIEKWRNMPDSPLDNLKEVAKLHAEELEAAWQAEQARGWLPIEEAPKDGWILVARGSQMAVVRWQERFNHWHMGAMAYFDNPEVWQPLPAPPQGDPNG